MSFRNQTRRWNRQMLSWISPKQLALLLLGTAILSFGMHNIHRRVVITEGVVLGMVLLLVLLGTGLLKARHVGDACDCLLDNMSLFFIPAGVAIMGCVSLLEGNALKFALVCVITTVIVFLATSYTVMLVSRLTAKRVDATGVARVADEEA